MLLSPDKVENGTFRPVLCPNGLVAFPRDYEATSLVWSNTTGYPCDQRYREFYRDIGYDLPLDYIAPYIEEDGNRIFTGYKYCAITGGGNEKKPYVLAQGRALTKEHEEVARRILRSDIRSTFLYGQEMYDAYKVLKDNDWNGELSFTEDFSKLSDEVSASVRQGDLFLVKGSRAATMERLIPLIRAIG